MTLRSSHLLLNRTGRTLQLCTSGPVFSAAVTPAAQPCAWRRSHLLPLLEVADSPIEAEGSQPVMVAAPGQGNGTDATALRVWLGPGNGWSLPVLLGSPQVNDCKTSGHMCKRSRTKESNAATRY